MKYFLIIAVFILIGGCTNESDARLVLDEAGLSDIQMTGYSWFACSDDDFYHTGFTAKNSKGRVVSGTVCSGLFMKGSTIRY